MESMNSQFIRETLKINAVVDRVQQFSRHMQKSFDSISNVIAAACDVCRPYSANCQGRSETPNRALAIEGRVIAGVGNYLLGARELAPPSNIAVPSKWKTQDCIDSITTAIFENAPNEGWKLAITRKAYSEALNFDSRLLELFREIRRRILEGTHSEVNTMPSPLFSHIES